MRFAHGYDPNPQCAPVLHRKLKAGAAQAGLSLSEFLFRDAQRLADQRRIEEMLARLERPQGSGYEGWRPKLLKA
jgi:hypothetical protein